MILNKVARVSLVEKLEFEQRLQNGELALKICGRGAFQVSGASEAKTLRQKQAWHLEAQQGISWLG